jgi:HK97 family phage major capsid protein
LTSATDYDGTFTNPVDKIIDASFGQIPTETNDFYQPTNVILHPRDVVKIGLNKATGSGEYDLPQNSVAFAQGRLQIAGLDTVPTTSITADNFLALDRNAVMFVRRMNPEIRMFEDATLAKQNKVMFRVEERVAQVIFNTDAIVTGTLTAEAEE